MKKTSKPSTKLKKAEIQPYPKELMDAMYSKGGIPVPDAYILKFAAEWALFVLENENVITLNSFYNIKKILAGTVEDWAKRVPELRDTKDYIKQVLADRRELGVITRKYEPSFIMRTHSSYDASYKALEEWRSTLANKADDRKGTFNIIVRPDEDCPMVPMLKKKESDDI